MQGKIYGTLLSMTVVATLLVAHEADAGGRRSRPVRTGQLTCWNTAGAVIACGGTGQDGDLRRGEPRAYVDNGNGTIRDQRTALTWEKLSNDGSIHDKDNAYTWDDAFGKVDDLNTAGFAGFTDWRLPNQYELETIRDLENVDPAISAPFDTACADGCTVLTCSCTKSAFYWTASSYALSPNLGWMVNFFDGYEYNQAKTSSIYVRAVRGGS